MKHTRGPWNLDTASDGSMAIIPNVGFTICPLTPREGFESDIPNFQLMSAAPELLDACQAIADLANGQGQINLVMVAAQARAAIAKATGSH